MLIIKKIQTQADFQLVEQADPQASSRIFLLNNDEGKSSFFPMTPLAKADTKTLFGLLPKLNATIWEGGYYVRDFSTELHFEGSLDSAATPRKLLTSLAIRINGIDMEQDVGEVVKLIHNGELYEEDLQRALYAARDGFFNTLASKLYGEESPKDAIFDLAVDSMTKFFPALKTEILFANMDEELTDSEKEYKAAMEQLNSKRLEMELEIKERQSESNRTISLMEIEENEESIRNTVILRKQERELSVKNNELQLRMLNETADDKVAVEKLKLAQEKAEIVLQIKLVRSKLASAAKEDAIKETRLEMLRDRQQEQSRENERREEIHRKQMEKEEAELEKLRLESEEIKQRIEALKHVHPSPVMPVPPRDAEEEVISNPAIRQQENLIKVLNEELLNTVSGVKSEALLNVLQEKSFTNTVTLEKDLAPVKISARGITLKKAFDDNAVRIGDEMRLSFTSPLRGYLTLICFSTSGAVTLLSPNIVDGTVMVAPGVKYSMPGEKLLSGYELQQNGPEGRERLAAIITPEIIISAPAGCDGFIDLTDADLNALSARLERLNGEWAAGYLGYTVVEKIS